LYLSGVIGSRLVFLGLGGVGFVCRGLGGVFRGLGGVGVAWVQCSTSQSGVPVPALFELDCAGLGGDPALVPGGLSHPSGTALAFGAQHLALEVGGGSVVGLGVVLEAPLDVLPVQHVTRSGFDRRRNSGRCRGSSFVGAGVAGPDEVGVVPTASASGATIVHLAFSAKSSANLGADVLGLFIGGSMHTLGDVGSSEGARLFLAVEPALGRLGVSAATDFVGLGVGGARVGKFVPALLATPGATARNAVLLHTCGVVSLTVA